MSWIIFAILMLWGLGLLIICPVGGIVTLLGAALCVPQVRKVIKSKIRFKTWVFNAGVVILCVIGLNISMQSDTASTNQDTIISETTQNTEAYKAESIDEKQNISTEKPIEIKKTGLIGGTAEEPVTTKPEPEIVLVEESKSDSQKEDSELQIHYIDVGQGDAALIMCDGEAMLIDAGDDSKGTLIQYYLQKQGVSKLKYVVITHPDYDHLGGADVVIYKFDCGTIIMPDSEKDTEAYKDTIETIEYKNYERKAPVVGDIYTLGSASFEIVSPALVYSNTNNNSVVLNLKHGNNKFLFAGDIEIQAEQEMIYGGYDISADVIKMPHHGSNGAFLESFYEMVHPTYAVISCGKDNSYGHPHQEVLNYLKGTGAQTFRTDEQGTIIATSDGKSITWNTVPSTSWKPGSEQNKNTSIETDVEAGVAAGVMTSEVTNIEQESQAPVAGITYVCNKNSMKFHRPDCSSVGDMKAKNRLDVTLTREKMIAQGYVPCKRCNP